MASTFERALNDDFIAALEVEATKEGWWADVLADPKLLIFPRGGYLNVYWRGQSLFCVKATPSGLKVTTHEKYLVNPKLASQVPLTDGVFDIESLLKNGGFIPRYHGKKTLADMKTAAGLFSGLEKMGCHEIAVRNFTVIDAEIAFGKVSLDDGGEDKQLPRVDLASLEACDHKEARLVFWEAKHFSNNELRAAGGRPAPVLRQVEVYKKYLSEHREEIEASYKKVAENLVSISNMRKRRISSFEISPLINDVATGKRQLTLGAKPKVGLIIFGFDIGQKNHAGWQSHLELLKKGIDDVRPVGDATKISLAK